MPTVLTYDELIHHWFLFHARPMPHHYGLTKVEGLGPILFVVEKFRAFIEVIINIRKYWFVSMQIYFDEWWGDEAHSLAFSTFIWFLDYIRYRHCVFWKTNPTAHRKMWCVNFLVILCSLCEHVSMSGWITDWMLFSLTEWFLIAFQNSGITRIMLFFSCLDSLYQREGLLLVFWSCSRGRNWSYYIVRVLFLLKILL